MSNLIAFAKKELELAKASESLYEDLLPKAVLELLECFSNQGHSGMSGGITLSLFAKLANFEPLTPLLGDDSEWQEVGERYWQNVRCPRVFKTFDGAYDSEGKVFIEPDGCSYTSIDSRVPITFPYNPVTEKVYVK